ncbi:MAG: UDP-N-acetylglucosamine 2-epimerase (non-hydrolyzing) [Bacteroidota bacterium]|jgi:UDP-GlcNAc3NAcA epimerase
MHKIITIVGARPQIIKAAALSRAFKNYPDIKELIVHTGQHYDFNMSAVFFEELEIPLPVYQFEIKKESQIAQTAQMMINLEQVILAEKPDLVLVYGDTNSTLAGALCASKLQIPLVHIEAGMRSFNKTMPEELNRIIADQCSTLLFCPTQTAINNLIREGFAAQNEGIASQDNPQKFNFGDIMLDNSLFFSPLANRKSKIIQKLNLKDKKFLLTTIHRSGTTDNPERLVKLIKNLLHLVDNLNLMIVLPVHPRLLKNLQHESVEDLFTLLKSNSKFMLTEPLSYLDMIQLTQNSELIITDSGGLQKEAYFFKKSCIILRNETEWEELTQTGNAILVDVDYEKMENACKYFLEKNTANFPPVFGDGNAAERIANEIKKFLG